MVEQAQQAAAESAAVVSSTTTTSGTDGTDGSSRPSRPSPRRAYVTMVTTDGGFVAGARVMLASLRQACRLPRAGVEVVVLVTAAVPSSARAALQPLCDEVREVEALENPYATHGGWADSGFTKLWVWGLTEYERVVYVDADCLVLEDLAELLERDVDFAAAPDVFPPDRFNAGLLVLKPDRAVFEDLQAKAQSKALTSYDGGDTGFLNAYFPDWFVGPPAARLPFAYNAQRTLHWMTHAKTPGYWEAVQPVKVLHFSSSPKPWEEAKRKGELEMLWWQHFLALQLRGLSA